MALQIWLPLNKNGDLKNQGLANVAVTNNGATYNSNGKIGGCYKVNGAQLLIPSASYMEMKSGKQFSFACWAKGATSSGWFIACSGWEIQFQTEHINVYPGEASGNRDSNFSGATAVDQWRHIAFTWDGSNLILYVDGNAQNTSTFNVSYNISSNIKFCYQGERYLNDVRIYDHCLSPKEVKEISKGLVLHYPLNNIINNNLLLRTPKTYSASAYLAYALQMTENLQAGQTYTMQLWDVNVSHTGKTANQLGIAVYWGGGNIPLKTYLGTSYFTNGHADYIVFSFTPTSSQASGSGATNAWLNIYNSPGSADGTKNMHIGYWKLEKGNMATTIGDSTKVYDSSGYNNNGTITGTLTTSTDTPRYDKCSVFSNNTYISAGKTHTALLDEYTISAWINPSTDDTNYHNFISCTQNGGMQLRIENKQFRHVVYLNNAYDRNTSTTTVSPNTWHHVVGVFKKGVGIKLYVNGVKESEVSNSGALTYNSTIDLMIGNEPDSNNQSTSGYSFSGKISDVRIYSTALSEQDIKALYQEAAFIDHKGDVGCYQFYKDVDSQINKTGQVKTGEFKEVSKNLFNKNEVAFNSCNYGSVPNAFTMNSYTGKCTPAKSIPVKPNTWYVLSYDETTVTINSQGFNTTWWDITGKVKVAEDTSGGSLGFRNKVKLKSPTNAYFVSFSNFGSISDANQQILVNSLQLEEGEAFTSYEPHFIDVAAVYNNKIECNQLIEI